MRRDAKNGTREARHAGTILGLVCGRPLTEHYLSIPSLLSALFFGLMRLLFRTANSKVEISPSQGGSNCDLIQKGTPQLKTVLLCLDCMAIKFARQPSRLMPTEVHTREWSILIGLQLAVITAKLRPTQRLTFLTSGLSRK